MRGRTANHKRVASRHSPGTLEKHRNLSDTPGTRGNDYLNVKNITNKLGHKRRSSWKFCSGLSALAFKSKETRLSKSQKSSLNLNPPTPIHGYPPGQPPCLGSFTDSQGREQSQGGDSKGGGRRLQETQGKIRTDEE